jgi:hypothetical protein
VSNILSANLIQDAFEPAVLSRGLMLLQANHVKTPKLLGSRGSTQFYEAEVIGSEGDRYSTHVFISPSGI